jgi:hypothetical protein
MPMLCGGQGPGRAPGREGGVGGGAEEGFLPGPTQTCVPAGLCTSAEHRWALRPLALLLEDLPGLTAAL